MSKIKATHERRLIRMSRVKGKKMRRKREEKYEKRKNKNAEEKRKRRKRKEKKMLACSRNAIIRWEREDIRKICFCFFPYLSSISIFLRRRHIVNTYYNTILRIVRAYIIRICKYKLVNFVCCPFRLTKVEASKQASKTNQSVSQSVDFNTQTWTLLSKKKVYKNRENT